MTCGLSSSGVLDPEEPDPLVPAIGTDKGDIFLPPALVPPTDMEVESDRGAVLGRRVCLIPPGVAYGLRITFEMNRLGAGCACAGEPGTEPISRRGSER